MREKCLKAESIEDWVPAESGCRIGDSRQFWLWGLLFAFTIGEGLFWWIGYRTGHFELMDGSRYIILQGEPVAGWERVIVNFRHFFLFWGAPPDAAHITNLYELWLSDGSSPSRNLLHPLVFGGLPFILMRLRFSALETLLWLTVFNLFREYVAEGWRLEPSFSDLWIDTVFSVAGVLVASRLCARRHRRSAERDASRFAA